MKNLTDILGGAQILLESLFQKSTKKGFQK